MNGRKIQIILFVIGVMLLTWLLIPVFSFAEDKPVAEKMVNAVEQAQTADEMKKVNDVQEAVAVVDSNKELKVGQAWAKPTLKGQSVAAAYLTIANTGNKAVALMEASASIAGRAEIHTHIHREGIMQMRQLTRLDVLANDSQMMKPGGLHLMLFDLKKPLKKGDNFMLTLKFCDDSHKKVKVEIRDVG